MNRIRQFKKVEPIDISYLRDKRKLWLLKDEVKTINYLQQFCGYDQWIEYQRRIDNLLFRIYNIENWKACSIVHKRSVRT